MGLQPRVDKDADAIRIRHCRGTAATTASTSGGWSRCSRLPWGGRRRLSLRDERDGDQNGHSKDLCDAVSHIMTPEG
jgi:hypothetical protein